MQKIGVKKHMIFLVICVISCCLFSTNILAFGSDTHKGVTRTALKIISELQLDDDELEPEDNNLDEKIKFSDFYDKKYWELLVTYSEMPDQDEHQGAYKFHFYNIVTGRNYMGEKDNALTRFVNHFNKAVQYYHGGVIDLAFQSLGRSLHFLEDLNTPVHTVYESPSDAVLKFPLHVRYENVCDRLQGELIAKISPQSLVYYEVNLLETIGKSCAMLSADNYYYLTDNNKENDISISRNAVLNAQKKVVGVFYKFFKQITDEQAALLLA